MGIFSASQVALETRFPIYFAAGALAGAGVVVGALGALGGGVVAGWDAGPGAGNVCLAAGGGEGVPLTTDPVPRWPMIDNARARSMNNAAQIVVAFVSSVAPERAPNAA